MVVAAAACSHHPVTAHATGEAVGQVLERLGRTPDLAVVIVTPGHAGALEDVARAVGALLDPRVLVGWSATSVGAGIPLPVPATPAVPTVGLWAGAVGPVEPLRRPSPGPAPLGSGFAAGPGRDAAVVGGLTDVGGAPAVLDGRVHAGGLVGAVLASGNAGRTIVEDGHRPIGPPLTITRVEGSLVAEIDGRPAMDVLAGIARDQVPAGDIPLINDTVHLARSDVSVLPGADEVAVLGRDAGTGAIATDGSVAEGSSMTFCVCDPIVASLRARDRLRSSPAGGLAWGIVGAGGTGPEDVGDAALACSASQLLGDGLRRPGIRRPGGVRLVVFDELPASDPSATFAPPPAG